MDPMTPEMLESTWSLLGRGYLEGIVRRGLEPVFATVSGAHLYGFASPDSDVDLRGAFLLSARDVLGLHPPSETITIAEKYPVDLDWVAHDLRKFCRLLTNHNGYVLESASRLQSQIEKTAQQTALPADVDERFVDGLLLDLVRGAR